MWAGTVAEESAVKYGKAYIDALFWLIETSQLSFPVRNGVTIDVGLICNGSQINNAGALGFDILHI